MEKKSTPFPSALCRKVFLLIIVLVQLAGLKNASAQAKRITGVVRDANGAGVPAVTVSIKGTTTATSTDSAGQYSLNVNGPAAVLVFSSVGYGSKEEIVGNRT